MSLLEKKASDDLFSKSSFARRRQSRRGVEIACASALIGWLAAGCGEEAAPGNDDEAQGEAARSATSSPAASARKFVPLQAIVKLKKGAKALTTADVTSLEKIEAMPLEISLLRFDPDAAGAKSDPTTATLQWIEALRARPDVEYAHPNWIFQLSRVPNDPLYPNQWHYPAIQLPAAWDLTTGHASTRIAILDTGRTAHPELAAKWVPGLEYDAVAQDGNAQADPNNTWSHGIHVAGIAGGSSNEFQGTAGVCWGCQLLNVKIAADNNPSLDGILRGITWAADNGARVLNMSFEANGAPCADPSWAAIRDALAYATSRGVVPVAAAGNQGAEAANTVPASCPDVIAVAATDRNNLLAAYSNRGAVTLAAPAGGGALTQGGEGLGSGVDCDADPNSFFHPTSTAGSLSAWTNSAVGNTDHCHRYLSGTSMATPHVAGVVGLMLSRNPNLTPAQVRQILQTTATPLPGCGGNCGAGLVNAQAAVQQAAPVPVADALPVPRITVSCTNLECTFSGGTSSDDRGIIAYQWTFPGQALRTGAAAAFFMPGYTSHTVRLRVTDTSGQSSETSQVVTPSQPTITPLAGSYYNPQRSGNGLDLYETSSGEWTAGWCTYEPGGAPVWYTSGVAPKIGARWSAPLYRVTWNGSAPTVTQVGTMSLDFTNSTTAWFSWVLNGVAGGERFSYLVGGQGRSGSWYVPTESGWGINVQESGSYLGATVTFYEGGQPRWMTGSGSPGANVTLPLSYYVGPGLCPNCGGNTRPTANADWSQSSMSLQIADGASTTGLASTNIQRFSFPFTFPVWVRPLQNIQLLTKP